MSAQPNNRQATTLLCSDKSFAPNIRSSKVPFADVGAISTVTPAQPSRSSHFVRVSRPRAIEVCVLCGQERAKVQTCVPRETVSVARRDQRRRSYDGGFFSAAHKPLCQPRATAPRQVAELATARGTAPSQPGRSQRATAARHSPGSWRILCPWTTRRAAQRRENQKR